jgi:hypothetical protein
MTTATRSTGRALRQAIADEGFAFVQGAAMRELLAAAGSLGDWQAFAESWNRLELDTYMADGGRYRRRRHAVFGAAPDAPIARTPHQPHYQTLDYNPLNGGVARWFEPVEDAIADSASLKTVLGYCRAMFDILAGGATPWKIEVHQFRIEARHGQQGLRSSTGRTSPAASRPSSDSTASRSVCSR